MTPAARVVLAVAVATCGGCGAEPAGGPVTVRGALAYVTGGAVDERVPALRAFHVAGDGAASELELTAGDGETTIAEAPAGAVWIAHEAGYVATRRRSIDAGAAVLGRADAATAAPDVAVALDLDGLAPWRDGGELQLYSPGAGLWAPVRPEGVAGGATALTADLPYGALGLPAVDADAGDGLWVTQLEPRAFAGGLAYAAVVRAADATGADVAGEDTPAIAATLAEVPAMAIAIDWDLEAFDALRLAERPILLGSVYDVLVAALPRGDRYGHYGAAADLGYGRWTDLGRARITGSLDLGDPFPEAWTRVVTSVAWYPVAVELPGTRGTTIWDAQWVRSAAEDLAPAIEPVVGPPRDVRAGAREVSWSPPAVGEPVWYQVEIYGLHDEGGITAARQSAVIVTDETELALPDEVFDADASEHVVRVGAVVDGRPDEPLVRGLPAGFASSLSERFSR